MATKKNTTKATESEIQSETQSETQSLQLEQIKNVLSGLSLEEKKALLGLDSIDQTTTKKPAKNPHELGDKPKLYSVVSEIKRESRTELHCNCVTEEIANNYIHDMKNNPYTIYRQIEPYESKIPFADAINFWQEFKARQASIIGKVTHKAEKGKPSDVSLRSES